MTSSLKTKEAEKEGAACCDSEFTPGGKAQGGSSTAFLT